MPVEQPQSNYNRREALKALFDPDVLSHNDYQFGPLKDWKLEKIEPVLTNLQLEMKGVRTARKVAGIVGGGLGGVFAANVWGAVADIKSGESYKRKEFFRRIKDRTLAGFVLGETNVLVGCGPEGESETVVAPSPMATRVFTPTHPPVTPEASTVTAQPDSISTPERQGNIPAFDRSLLEMYGLWKSEYGQMNGEELPANLKELLNLTNSLFAYNQEQPVDKSKPVVIWNGEEIRWERNQEFDGTLVVDPTRLIIEEFSPVQPEENEEIIDSFANSSRMVFKVNDIGESDPNIPNGTIIIWANGSELFHPSTRQEALANTLFLRGNVELRKQIVSENENEKVVRVVFAHIDDNGQVDKIMGEDRQWITPEVNPELVVLNEDGTSSFYKKEEPAVSGDIPSEQYFWSADNQPLPSANFDTSTLRLQEIDGNVYYVDEDGNKSHVLFTDQETGERSWEIAEAIPENLLFDMPEGVVVVTNENGIKEIVDPSNGRVYFREYQTPESNKWIMVEAPDTPETRETLRAYHPAADYDFVPKDESGMYNMVVSSLASSPELDHYWDGLGVERTYESVIQYLRNNNYWLPSVAPNGAELKLLKERNGGGGQMAVNPLIEQYGGLFLGDVQYVIFNSSMYNDNMGGVQDWFKQTDRRTTAKVKAGDNQWLLEKSSVTPPFREYGFSVSLNTDNVPHLVFIHANRKDISGIDILPRADLSLLNRGLDGYRPTLNPDMDRRVVTTTYATVLDIQSRIDLRFSTTTVEERNYWAKGNICLVVLGLKCNDSLNPRPDTLTEDQVLWNISGN
jgi:hypothetical protein